ncbi:cytochrome P450 [Xanthobacter sp. V4C-4]|uniref:cytochrome P450 n=1 Tax=Xanthobacter cornucopiae TaxID=3119924 RepID=UPI00372B9F84
MLCLAPLSTCSHGPEHSIRRPDTGMSARMSDFVPPFPPRPAKSPSIFEMLRHGSANFLTIFEDKAFEYHTMTLQVLTRQVFICNSPVTVAEALVHKHENFARKSPQIRSGLAPLVGDGLFVSDGPLWETRRAVVEAVLERFRPQGLPALAQALDEVTATWGDDREVDALDAMNRLSAKMIGRLLFGRGFADADASALVGAIADYQAHASRSDLPMLLGLPNWTPWLKNAPIMASAAVVRSLFDTLIARTRNAPDSIAHALGAAGGLEGEALRNELICLFIGGYDPMASLLAWTLYLLSQAPDVEEQVRAEAEGVIGDAAPAPGALKALPYARAVVSETLRLYPPVLMLARQATHADVICDHKIAAGALVVVVPWLLHRHRDFWDAPDAFRPARFLPDSTERKVRKYTYIPFSVGPRACPAATLGLTDAVLAVAMLVSGFAFELKPGTVVEPIAQNTIRPGRALPLRVRRRAGAGSFAAPRSPSPAFGS